MIPVECMFITPVRCRHYSSSACAIWNESRKNEINIVLEKCGKGARIDGYHWNRQTNAHTMLPPHNIVCLKVRDGTDHRYNDERMNNNNKKNYMHWNCARDLFSPFSASVRGKFCRRIWYHNHDKRFTPYNWIHPPNCVSMDLNSIRSSTKMKLYFQDFVLASKTFVSNLFFISVFYFFKKK